MTGELDTAPDPAVVTEAPDPTADMGAAWDRLMVNNGSDRDESGRFASHEGTDGAAKPASQTAPAGAGEGAGDAGATGAVTAAPAPAHLPQAIKNGWDKIPDDVRSAIAAHQTDMDRKFGELGKQYGVVKPIADRLTEATTRYKEFAGMTPEQLAQGAVELAAVQARLNKEPVATIIDVAKHYNVLPQLAAALAAAPRQDGQQPGADTQLITGLHQKIASLENQLKEAKDATSPEKIKATVASTMADKETEASVREFASKSEFWADVEAFMPAYIKLVLDRDQNAAPADVLKTAYDMAINADPHVRAKVRAAEAKATAAPANPGRADAARKAASINVKSQSNGKDRARTFEEAAGEAWDRVMAN